MHDRRRFLAGAAGAAAVAGLGSPAQAGASLVSPERLFRWVEEMNELGPRITGGHAHRRYLRLMERQLESYGLPVRRYPVPLDQWEARSWSLKVRDAEGREHRIPVAHYRPHSGETPRRGVTAGLVDVGAGQEADYAGKDVQGRIVVADYPLVRIPFGAVFPLADYIHRPAEVPQLAAEDYTRIWQTPPTSASLDLAKQHGAIAMIDIVDLSPEHAAGQYSPHQQHQVGLPALHLDRVQGRRLRDLMATGPVTATLVLDADKKTTTIDYLTTTLKGDGSRTGAIMLGTHTDGQNAIEENGVPAILALARYFTRLPRSERPRDIIIVLSPNHMNSHRDSPDLHTWLESHPEIRDRITAALIPEHLGALGWAEDPATGAYAPTGRTEPAVLGVGNSPTLTALVIDQLKRDDLPRTAVLRPLGDGLYGEATYPYRLGIPTATLISGPTYLVQTARDGHLNKLDPALLHHQTRFLANLLTRMLTI